MAITKKRKIEFVKAYSDWAQRSKAMVVTQYKGLPMKEFDALRARIRENGGEFHVVKNTLGKLAFKEVGLTATDTLFEGDTAVGFAFEDAPSLAKTIAEYARTSEFLKIKGGFLGDKVLSPAEVTALAELPPLPVMRARLLGVLLAPAGQLARTLAEPGRQIAAVLKAYSDREAAPAAETAQAA